LWLRIYLVEGSTPDVGEGGVIKGIQGGKSGCQNLRAGSKNT